MTVTLVKKGTDLTPNEIAELEAIYRLTNAQMPGPHRAELCSVCNNVTGFLP